MLCHAAQLRPGCWMLARGLLCCLCAVCCAPQCLRHAAPSPSQGRPQEVYGAFAAFRQRRCRPLQASDKAPQGQGSRTVDTVAFGVVAGTAVASAAERSGGSKAATAGAAGTAGGGSSGSQLELMSRQAALADRLVYVGELLHILRPVVYALALRR